MRVSACLIQASFDNAMMHDHAQKISIAVGATLHWQADLDMKPDVKGRCDIPPSTGTECGVEVAPDAYK